MCYSFQINREKIEWGGGRLQSIKMKERRVRREKGWEDGREGRRERENWDQRARYFPKVTQQVRGKARTRVLFPQNPAASLSPHGDYQSRNLNPAFPTIVGPHCSRSGSSWKGV